MKRARTIAGAVALTAAMTMGAGTAFAMPADIEEAVTQDGYNAYVHTTGTATYDESELLDVKGTYIATANAMIRQAPFGEILGSTVPGQAYQVVGECPDCLWYKVSGDVSGYVYASYLVPEGEYNQATGSNSDHGYNVRPLDMMMTVEAFALNVRTAPSLDAGVLTSLELGTEVHVTGKVLNSDWYECSWDGQTVYMSDTWLKPEMPQTMACTVDALNIREGAGTDTAVIGTLKQGDKVKVSADEGGWLKFTLNDGRIGYVYDEYMAAIGQ